MPRKAAAAADGESAPAGEPRRSSQESVSTATVSAFTTTKGTTAVPVTGSVTTNFELDSSRPPADGYTFYTSPISFQHLSHLIHATVDGEAYLVWVPTVVGTGV
ncbi:hypothetical protein B0H14DRAFT_3139878 [Mycena olivaceomarginata]|nr:hypothetical protein B0H14DRAFT_3139878 [Mycena olivaceomarginata]